MARIRTIKPEFPQSESIGRCSRDARLLFIQLWTLCDDSGRTRAASRMLASLLYPYDDDAPKLIDSWLKELEDEGCVVRYQVDGQSYLQICKWLNHQKIDKPSRSKIPEFVEPSPKPLEASPTPREVSSEDLRTKGPKDQGSKDQGKETRAARESSIPDDVDPQVWTDWHVIRKGKRAGPVTVTSLNQIRSDATKVGLSLNDALLVCCKRNWVGFDSAWIDKAKTLSPAEIAAEADRLHAAKEANGAQ